MLIKKKNIEWICIILLFSFSFINQMTLLISTLLLLGLLSQKEIGAIKIINLLTVRTIINPGIAVSFSTLESVKLFLIILLSIYLIYKPIHFSDSNQEKFKILIKWILIFYIYTMISSFLFSTLPTIAIFKITSYIIPFIGVIIGVAKTNELINWIDWLFELSLILIMGSLVLLPFPVGYLRNGVAFQGIINHPNLFGIISLLFFALIVTRYGINENSNQYLFIISSIVLLSFIILSQSRTSFITYMLLIILYLTFKKFENALIKYTVYVWSFILLIIYLLWDNSIIIFIKEFMYKGQELGGLFNSRENQIANVYTNFLNRPFFGSGFSVPVTEHRSYSFNLDALVEPGNLLLAVLSYVGIFGFIIWLIYLFKILTYNTKSITSKIYLPLSVIAVSFGEMIFFSTNNIGVLLYMYFAIYMFYDSEENPSNLN